MPRYHAKVDLAQAGIVKALRGMGAVVQSLAMVGQGVPDILCAYSGKTYLAEIKTGNAKLNEREQRWHDVWNKQGRVYVWRTPEEAIRDVSEHLEIGE